jgi:hypothetical protein
MCDGPTHRRVCDVTAAQLFAKLASCSAAGSDQPLSQPRWARGVCWSPGHCKRDRGPLTALSKGQLIDVDAGKQYYCRAC